MAKGLNWEKDAERRLLSRVNQFYGVERRPASLSHWDVPRHALPPGQSAGRARKLDPSTVEATPPRDSDKRVGKRMPAWARSPEPRVNRDRLADVSRRQMADWVDRQRGGGKAK